MIQKLQEQFKNANLMKFSMDVFFNMALVFLVYTLFNSFFSKPSEPENSAVGASFAQQQLQLSTEEKYSPIFIRTDKMDVIIDRVNGVVSEVMLRDQQASIIPNKKDRKMFANIRLTSDKLIYKASKNTYNMGDNEQMEVKLTAKSNGILHTKVYTFKKGQYDIDVQVSAQNQSGEDIKISPAVDIAVSRLSDAETGPVPLKSFSVQDQVDSYMPMAKLYEGFSSSGSKKNYQRLPVADIEKAIPSTIKGGWIAYQSGYFLTAWVLPEGTSTKVAQAYAQDIGEKKITQKALLGAQSSTKVLSPEQKISTRAVLYTGPSDPAVLADLSPGLKLAVDYGFFWIIANLLHKALAGLHYVGLSWGWSLVVLVVVLRLLFYKQAKDQVKHNQAMESAKPALDAIDKKYENKSRFDQKRSEEVLEVYKRYKINPIMTCLMPMLNLPIYMATYSMVLASFEFKSQSLLWINDLSVADPYYIFPVLAGLGLFIQTQSSQPVSDPAIKIVMHLMPLLFLFAMFNAPACVTLYVTLQMWVQALQTKMIQRI
ncbi:membrane protein insertase YidC [Gammaproteobacteria bacterium]|nr:membrane protein insertase YidC [Gammaproteobacteria bacterium]